MRLIDHACNRLNSYLTRPGIAHFLRTTTVILASIAAGKSTRDECWRSSSHVQSPLPTTMQCGVRPESAGQAYSGKDLTAKRRCLMCQIICTSLTAIPDVDMRSRFAELATLVNEGFVQSRWLTYRLNRKANWVVKLHNI